MPQAKPTRIYARAALKQAKQKAKRVVDAEARRPQRGRPRTSATALADARRQMDERMTEETVRALSRMPREGRVSAAPFSRASIARLLEIPLRRVSEALGVSAAVVVGRMRKQAVEARRAGWRVKTLAKKRFLAKNRGRRGPEFRSV